MPKKWEVVGTGKGGGIMVRQGEKLKSEECPERLGTGALIEEIQLKGERLNFKLLDGKGPAEGWVSLTVSGKEMVRRKAPGPEDWPGMVAEALGADPVETTVRAAGPFISPAGKAPGKARVRLVIFPWTGNRGDAGAMNNFTKWIKTFNEVCPADTWELVQANYPGRGTRMKDANHTESMACVTETVDALVKCGPCPTVLFGFSFGGVLAYEAAQLLTSRGEPPIGLCVVSCEAPGWAGRKIGQGADGGSTKDMSDEDFEKMLADKGGTTQILENPDMKKMFLPVIRSDMTMEEAYGAAPPEHGPLGCPIIAFRGEKCPRIAREDMDPWMAATSCHWEGSPSRIQEIHVTDYENEVAGMPWLSDWYLCQPEASSSEIIKAMASSFGGAQ